MGFDQKLKDLLRLQTTRPDTFTAELDEPWPGMQSDIELALGILMEYQQRGSAAGRVASADRGFPDQRGNRRGQGRNAGLANQPHRGIPFPVR